MVGVVDPTKTLDKRAAGHCFGAAFPFNRVYTTYSEINTLITAEEMEGTLPR